MIKFNIFFLLLFLCLPNQLLANKAVKLGEKEIFVLGHGLGAFTLDERVSTVEARLDSLLGIRGFDPKSLVVTEYENSSNILYQDRVIISITDRDAKFASVNRSVLADKIKNTIQMEVVRHKENTSWRSVLRSIAYVFLSSILLLFLLNFISKFFPGLLSTIQSWSIKNIPSMKIKNFELMSSNRLVDFIAMVVRSLRVMVTLLLMYLYIPLVFSFFPYTSGWADKIFGYVANPLKSVAKVIVDYIPNLFFVGVILILTNYLLQFLKFIFTEIEAGSIQFSGFYKEWAMPTYKLIRFLVFAFSLVVIFPYLPGSGSPAFQGVSVFLGVLVSFGSSSAISNVVAGIVLTYMRPFKLKDRVKIADTVGDVVEKTLLVTRIRTTKNVDVTIPNSMVLGTHLINYSSSATNYGLIVHPKITIGYDVDWRIVHKLLIAAAGAVEEIKKDPAPFVLQTSLDDFYVAYELNAYTDRPGKMAYIYSELHKNIQDQFKEAGVEIMSPHFSAIRDGSNINIPTDGGETKFVQALRLSPKDLNCSS